MSTTTAVPGPDHNDPRDTTEEVDNVRYLPSARIPTGTTATDGGPCLRCGTTAEQCAQLLAAPAAVVCCAGCEHTEPTDHVQDIQDRPGTAMERKIFDGEVTADPANQHEHPGQGLDVRAGAELVPAGTRLPAQLPDWAKQGGRSTGRWVKRNAGYAVAGSRVRRAERRARRKHTDLEQAIATVRINAKSTEDFSTLRELEETLEKRRNGHTDRARQRRAEVLKWTGGVIVVTGAGHVILLGYSLVDSIFGHGSIVATWDGLVDFWSTVADCSPVGSWWWAWAVGAAATWAVRSVAAGRAGGQLPVWAQDAAPAPAGGRGVVPNESAVLDALRYLSIPAIKEAFKQGWGSSITPTWPQVPVREGKGWRMQLVLPKGAPVDEIVKKKNVLAHNLVRLPVEVWPTEPTNQPGVLDLWVADQGALSEPMPPWPLLHDGESDYFQSVPVGMNIRGDVVRARLFEVNYALAGMMGSGKSTLIINLLLGALLDPLVEADVFVFASNADYDPMAPRLRTLRTGPQEEHVKECLERLRELYNDLTARGDALKEHGADRKVTRKLALKDARLRPRVLVIDECQALFMHPKYGEEASDLATLVVNAARKYAVTLILATPEPSTASLPRKIMSVTACKACFAIGDQQSNDAILGTGSYKQGISAVSLEPKTDESPGDVGTAMVRGIMAKPGLLRSFYLRKDDTVDEVTPVVERALALRDDAGITAVAAAEQPQVRDYLADISEAMRAERRVRTAIVLARLMELDRSYEDMSSQDFAQLLATDVVGLKIHKSGGNSVLRLEEVIGRLAERDDDPDDVDE